MRIVSLLPSTTEILFGLGAGEEVVGVTFECDFPDEARSRTIVSSSAMPEGLSPREIDDFVAAAAARGEDLYRLEGDALVGLDAELVVTQDLCAVCAIDVGTVDAALSHLGCAAEVHSYDPYSIGEIFDGIVALGERVGRAPEATAWVASLTQRLDVVAELVGGLPAPRVLLLEWTDPPFAPGHWIPEMVERAGGIPVLGRAGQDSVRVTWEQVDEAAPDVVVVAPCGFDLDGAASQAELIADRFPGLPVWAVDADAMFARPGPRVVDGVEALAAAFHPSLGLTTDGARRVSPSRRGS
ncbi:cobalamin-binding protein [Aeromicrobium flavum]|uniref:Cobalamin-binding protein n=1 Tax=Aeromicrobium flavum TaxID=416568 RepID=A0A512HUE6_9ACTN|nr:cobalamin-binding protein [Aeromicrobium flavum]GEO89058.1 cobalamin-binding protein [Aeromicrobium flavum]